MELKTEAKIGIIVAATLLLVFWGINFLKGRNVLKRTDVYHAVFQDVQGLDVSAPVTLRGLKIGLVTDLTVKQDHINTIIVSFSVDADLEIPKGTEVQIYSPDLLGSKALGIIPGDASEYHKYGDTLKSSVKKDLLTSLGEEISPVMSKMDTALLALNNMLLSLNQLLDENTLDHFRNTMANLDNSSRLLKQQLTDGNLKHSLESLDKFLLTLSQNREKLDAIFSNIENITDSVAVANINSMVESMNSGFTEAGILLENMNSGQGSLGKLAVDDSLYVHLDQSVKSLNLLLSDLNENPGRYVRFSIFGGRKKKD